MKSVCRIDFVDNQNRTDRISKFILIYQDLDIQRFMLRPLTSTNAREVANVLVGIFSTLGIPCILKCEKDKIFTHQVVCYLYHLGINITMFHKNIKMYHHKNPTPIEDINKIISQMLDTWLMINDTNKWNEGLDVIEFQMNHNIYYEAIHLPINFNNIYSLSYKQYLIQLKSKTKSVSEVNAQAKKRKTATECCGETILRNLQKKTNINVNVSVKAKIDLSIFSNPTEDDNKYEIIEEILDKLEQKNPISSLKENHNKEFPQLFQKATKACSNTKVLQKHVECNISNTTNEEQIHQLVQEAAQECSNLDMSNMQINEELIESNTIEKEDLLQLTEKVAQKCSNLKGPYVNDNSSASTTTDEKNVPVDTRSSQGM